MIEHLSRGKEDLLHFFIFAASYAGAVGSTIFSLTHGIFEVFPFLYILPIILSVFFYPKRAVLLTLIISLTYIGLVYQLGFTNLTLIAVATAWFAIFMTIGIVASSYANQLLDEKARIQHILKNSQDGILCFDISTGIIAEIDAKCARWLRYERPELLGVALSSVWPDNSGRERFIGSLKNNPDETETEGLFRAKDGTVLRFVISALMVTRGRALCSVIDITGDKIVDEEIRRTLEDLEEQVKARTAHLERINEELRTEILEHRKRENNLLAGQARQMDEEDRT
jgi:PAS domain-containing protein